MRSSERRTARSRCLIWAAACAALASCSYLVPGYPREAELVDPAVVTQLLDSALMLLPLLVPLLGM